jgi:hypothetical protein
MSPPIHGTFQFIPIESSEWPFIHAIWREKGNEYGEDVLKAHYQSEKH